MTENNNWTVSVYDEKLYFCKFTIKNTHLLKQHLHAV